MSRTSHTAHVTPKAAAGLHVCSSCGSDLVQPTRWEQAGGRGKWRLWRRCPECEWSGDAVFGEGEIDAYDEELDAGTRALTGALHQVERENMEHIAEAFAAAMRADLLTADDFR